MGLMIVSSAAAPPGSTFDSMDPTNNAELTVAISSVSIALAAVFLLARLYSNLRLTRSVGYDDYACIIAMLLSAGFFGLIVWGSRPTALAASFLKAVYIGTLISTTGLFMARLSLFLLLLRLFAPNRILRCLVYLGIALSAVLVLAVIIVNTVLCLPRHSQHWNPPTVITRYSQEVKYFTIVQGSMNICLDFYIMAIPIPVLWKLQLPLRKKIGVITIFMTGLIACAASLLGLIYRIKFRITPENAWDTVIAGLFCLIEINIAITCSSMPAFAAFSKHVVSHTRSYLQIRSRPTTDGFTNLGSSYPVRKSSPLAAVPSCYTVSQAQGRDKTFLAKTQLKNQIHKGDAETLCSLLPVTPTNGGGIIQSLEVDVMVSTNHMRGGGGNLGDVIPHV